MEEIYGAMVIAFGRPPKPDESFEWTYTDKDGKYHRVKSTPTQFYKDSDFKAEEHFSLINDPRHEYSKLYSVDRLKNSTPQPLLAPVLFWDRKLMVSFRGKWRSIRQHHPLHHEIRRHKNAKTKQTRLLRLRRRPILKLPIRSDGH